MRELLSVCAISVPSILLLDFLLLPPEPDMCKRRAISARSVLLRFKINTPVSANGSSASAADSDRLTHASRPSSHERVSGPGALTRSEKSSSN
jgi:hypothetical protein